MKIWKKIYKKEKKNFRPGDFTESTEYLSNPGQGWYRIFTYDAGRETVLEEENATLEGESLALVRINIGRYRCEKLPETALENIRRILLFFGQRGVDMILRIVYDLEGKGLEREPDLFSLVRDHMLQLSALIHEFEDRILVYQGLLVGSWGEMHQSKFLAEKWLLDLESAFRSHGNDKVWLAVRRPVFLRMLIGTEDASLGKRTMFNDAVGSSQTDMGTYGWKNRKDSSWKEAWVREEEVLFIERVLQKAPFGGEALLPEKGYEITSAEIVKDMRRMHLSYLNCQHDRRVLELWKKRRWHSTDVWNNVSLYDYIGSHLGYRFCVRGVSVSRGKGSGIWSLCVVIENIGFGNLCQEAEAELIRIDKDGERSCQRLDWDAREWDAGRRITCWAQIVPEEGSLYIRLRRKWDGGRILFSNKMNGDIFCLGTMA